MIWCLLVTLLSLSSSLLQVGIVTTNDVVFDGTFIENAYNEGLQLEALGKWNMTVIIADGSNYEQKIRAASSVTPFDLLVTFSYQHAEVTLKLAPVFPNTKWVLIDYSLGTATPPNVQGVIYRNDQLGYLGGVVAGMITKEKKIGMVSGQPVTALLDINDGAKQAILSVCPDCAVFVNYTQTFASPALGNSSAQWYIDKGCDVIMGAGGLTGSSAILYAAERGIWVTGVDADEYYGIFKNQPINITQYLLTSWLKGVGIAIRNAATSIENNNFQGGTTNLYSVATGGVDLAGCHDSCGFWSAANESKKAEVLDQLRSGALQTGINLADSNFSHSTSSANNTFVQIIGFNDVPLPVSGHTTAINGTAVFIFGGLSGPNITNNLYDFNYEREVWTQHFPSPNIDARRDSSAVIYQGNLYLFGGRFANGTITNEFWRYDCAAYTFLGTNAAVDAPVIPPFKWTQITAGGGPGPRSGHKAFVFGSTMYISQGTTDQGDGTAMYAFHFDTSTWSVVPPSPSSDSTPPPPLQEFCTADDGNGTFYLFGGFQFGAGSSQISSNDLYRYDAKINHWTLMKTGDNKPNPVTSCAAVWATSRFIVYGGVFNSVFLDQIWVYDVREFLWEVLPSDPSYPPGRLDHSMNFYNMTNYQREQLLIFGGSLQGSVSNEFYQVTLPPLKEIRPKTFFDCNSMKIFEDTTGLVSINRSLGIYPIDYYCDGYIDCSNSWDEGFSCSPSLQALWVAMGVVGIIVLIGLFILSILLIYYYDHPIIKASTPLFLMIILIGGVVGTWAIFPLMLAPTPLRCGSVWWLLGFGFVLIMGSIVVKNFRIYLIFSRAEKLVSFSMKESELVLYLLLVLFIDLVILAVWTAVPEKNPYQTILIKEPNSGDADPKHHEVCVDQLDNPCLWVFIIYQGLIVVASAIIAFKTRSIEKKFQESKYITLAIYSYLIVALVILPILMLGLSTPLAGYTVAMVAIIIAVVIPIVMLFFPKLRNIWYPKGPREDSSDSSGMTVSPRLSRITAGSGKKGPTTSDIGPTLKTRTPPVVPTNSSVS